MNKKSRGRKSPGPRPTPNFYSGALSEEQRGMLSKARRGKGLRAEIELLRVWILGFARAREYDTALKVTTVLARLEEADSRIKTREGDSAEEREMGESRVFELLRSIYPESEVLA